MESALERKLRKLKREKQYIGIYVWHGHIESVKVRTDLEKLKDELRKLEFDKNYDVIEIHDENDCLVWSYENELNGDYEEESSTNCVLDTTEEEQFESKLMQLRHKIYELDCIELGFKPEVNYIKETDTLEIKEIHMNYHEEINPSEVMSQIRKIIEVDFDMYYNLHIEVTDTNKNKHIFDIKL